MCVWWVCVCVCVGGRAAVGSMMHCHLTVLHV